MGSTLLAKRPLITFTAINMHSVLYSNHLTGRKKNDLSESVEAVWSIGLLPLQPINNVITSQSVKQLQKQCINSMKYRVLGLDV